MGENDEIKTVDAVVADEKTSATEAQPKAQFENGLFAKGNTLGALPKKPTKRQEYLAAWHSAIGFDEMREVALAMYALARQGDTQAAKLICDYNLGKPVQSVEVETNGTVSHGVLQVNFVSPPSG